MLSYLLDGDFEKPFLSKYFVFLDYSFLPFAIGLLDLPLTASNSKSSHKFEGTDGRGIKITAASNMILFLKHINESSNFQETDIVIKHRYFNYGEHDK